MKTPTQKLLPIEDAMERIFSRIPEPLHESVPLSAAANRVLAVPLHAAHSQPPFNSSAMDGYAVRSADVVPGEPLELIGTSQAGAAFDGVIGPGQCVRIFTGAPVPDGADAVIMQEEASASGDEIRFQATPPTGRSIRKLGNDFWAGQELIAKGTPLSPFALSLAATANQPELLVTKQPRIAILATGDELVPPGSVLAPGQIAASNSAGLVPLLAPFAQHVMDLGIVSDDPKAIAQAIDGANGETREDYDIVITTGGASVGDHDVVQEVLTSIDVELHFWRINMRPGKPLMFGTRGKTLFFGLPGNPVSAMITAMVFILPALRQWLGYADPMNKRLRLPLAASTLPNRARRHFQRAMLDTDEYGQTAVFPIIETDSGHTSSLAQADSLIVQPEHDPGQDAGEIVDVIPFNGWP